MNKQEHIYRSPKEIALSEMIQASTEELDPLKLFPLAIKELGNVMIEGSAKYPPNNWKKNPSITVIDHVIHATQHLKELVSPRANDIEELSHAATRCMMALQIILEKND